MKSSSRDRLAIVGHQPLFVVGVLTYLRAESPFDIVAEGVSSSDALRFARDSQPDVMLIDPPLKAGRVDANAASAIATARPEMRLIVMSTSENEDDVTQLLRSGVHGYVLKDTQPDELLNAIAIVLSGQVYVAPSLGARLVSKALRPAQCAIPAHTKLSAREDAILSQAAMGSTNKEIAQSFSLSEKTVKYYMTSIMKKLRVRNRVEAIVMMRQQLSNEPLSPTSM